MYHRKEQKAKPASTPLCYVAGEDGKQLGHIWNRLSTRIQKCSRCGLVQYKTPSGHWKNTTSIKAAYDAIKADVVQHDMFTELGKDTQ